MDLSYPTKISQGVLCLSTEAMSDFIHLYCNIETNEFYSKEHERTEQHYLVKRENFGTNKDKFWTNIPAQNPISSHAQLRWQWSEQDLAQ